MIVYPFFVVKGKLTHEKENFSYRDRSTRSYTDQGTIEAQHACRVIKESPAKKNWFAREASEISKSS